MTITFGFGPSLFRDQDGNDRFGIADRRPEALEELPHFTADVLDPARSGGDLCVQACADDPQVAVHAIRNLVRLGFGTVAVRWSQLGFGRTSSTSTAQTTPRNLFGFKDGTANVKSEETGALEEHVWVSPDDDGGDWLAGGSYLVARRINMTIEVWDRQPLGDQEAFVGRTKGPGAPLSGGDEFTEPDFDMPGSNNLPVIQPDAHIRLVHPTQHGGARMLRRGYNFVDGSDAIGGLDAGLFFIAFVRDPRTQFIPPRRRWPRPMPSWSTSRSPARPCSPYRPASGRPSTSGSRCSRDLARGPRLDESAPPPGSGGDGRFRRQLGRRPTGCGWRLQPGL